MVTMGSDVRNQHNKEGKVHKRFPLLFIWIKLDVKSIQVKELKCFSYCVIFSIKCLK